MQRRAFTLVEVLVAIAVLAIGAAALYNAFIYQGLLQRRVARVATAANLLRVEAERVLSVDPREVRDSAWTIPFRDTVWEVERTVLDSAVALRAAWIDREPSLREQDSWSRRPREVRLRVRVGEPPQWLAPGEADAREVVTELFVLTKAMPHAH